MNRLLLVLILSCGLVMGTTSLQADDAAKPADKAATTVKTQTTCPVSGEKLANKDVYVDAEGKRIYLCCAGCAEKAKKNAKKIIQKLEADGITLDKTPAAPASK